METRLFRKLIDEGASYFRYISLDGPGETITLTHTTRDRSGFARGALEAARWVHGRSGWFTMNDVLGTELVP